MTRIRWKNQFPPTAPRGGYQMLVEDRWVEVSVEFVRALDGLVLWV